MRRALFLTSLLAMPAFCSELSYDGYLRAMYLTDKNYDVSAVGGMLAISPTFDSFNSRIAFYTVAPIGDKTDAETKLFSDSKNGYSELGEASIGYKTDKISIVVGRQKVTTPLVDMDDGRIIPNLYEGISAKYTPQKDTTIEAYYLTRMSGFWSQIFSSQNMSHYVSMSEAAGYASVAPDSALMSLGITHKFGDNTFSGWIYHTPDLMDTVFCEYKKDEPLNQNTRIQFAIQGSKQSANGKLSDDLKSRGKTLEQEYVGVKLGATNNDLSGYLAATFVNDSNGKMDKNMMNVWAGIPQYTVVNEFVMKSFNTDGAKMYKAQVGYKFSSKTEATASYLYFDGLSKINVKDEGIAEFVLSTKLNGFSLNGVVEIHNVDSSSDTIFKSTLEYHF